jgi:N-acetylmuramoyl-L-alanine amidase
MIPKLYPKAQVVGQLKDFSVAEFPFQQPVGCTIHYTASGSDMRALLLERKMQGKGYHLLIDRDGSITQMAWLDHKVFHAGNAAWKNLSPNRWFIAVALINWGYVRLIDGKYRSWSGVEIPPEDVRSWIHPLDTSLKFWQRSTLEQLDSLWQVMTWLKSARIRPELVCGHDECCIPPGRKVDPGGCLAIPMADFRTALQNDDQVTFANLASK